MIDGKERRLSPRVVSRFPLRYQAIPFAGGGYCEARVEDLSSEGLRFQCRDEVRDRGGMLLELQLPAGMPVHFFGRAAWVRELPNNGGFEVGGRFEDQSTWGRKTIEQFLQRDSVSPAP
ncbi:MAG: PilZ domain-containing protein [Candidatus Methylomirabilia bacterium]